MGLSPGLSRPIEIIFSLGPPPDDASFADGLRLLLGAQHDGHVGAVDVGIEQADFVAQLRERQGQVHGYRGFAYAAFAAGDRDQIFHAGDRLTLRHWLGCWSWRHWFALSKAD